MVEYIYKGFKLSYSISQVNAIQGEAPLFEAHGNAAYLFGQPDWFTQTHLHAEAETHERAEQSIKLCLENHIDYVLKNHTAEQGAQPELT